MYLYGAQTCNFAPELMSVTHHFLNLVWYLHSTLNSVSSIFSNRPPNFPTILLWSFQSYSHFMSPSLERMKSKVLNFILKALQILASVPLSSPTPTSKNCIHTFKFSKFSGQFILMTCLSLPQYIHPLPFYSPLPTPRLTSPISDTVHIPGLYCYSDWNSALDNLLPEVK